MKRLRLINTGKDPENGLRPFVYLLE